MSGFVFKQFTVKQEKSAMKIGTDSVLLGCLCEPGDAQHILDIGTGTGLLALMMAQRSHAHIDAVETDEEATLEATANFAASNWSNRLHIHHQPVQQYAAECRTKYSVIISNPPYFKAGHNVPIADAQRSKARHDASLTFAELAHAVTQLLAAHGSFWLILPVAEAAEFKQAAHQKGLFCNQNIGVMPKAGQAANRFVMQFGLHEKQPIEKEFVVYASDGTPSAAYKQVAKDFYTGQQFRK